MSHTNKKQSCLEHRLITSLPYPAALLDQAGCIVAANQSFLAEVRQSDNPCDGTSITKFITPSCMTEVQRYLADTQPTNREICTTLRTGVGAKHLYIKRISANDPQGQFLCHITIKADESASRSRFFMEHTDQGAWEYDTRSDTFVVSGAWRSMRGISQDEDINADGQDWFTHIHPDDRDALREMFQAQTRGEFESIKIQYRRKHKDGHWVWILCQARIMKIDAESRPLRIVGTDTDITLVKQAETDLQQLTSKLQLAIEASGMGIWEFDPSNAKVHWDDRMLEIYGLGDNQNDRSDDAWETFIHPDDVEETVAYADKCNRENLDFNRDYRILRPDGGIRRIRSLARFVTTGNAGKKLIGVNIDVTDDYLRTQELEQARRQLEYDSRHDALTGLANRRRLDKVTHELFARVGQEDTYAVMHLDLDHFKDINDTLGHAAGDTVLIQLTNRISKIVGETGLVSRVGGDEFVILFSDAPALKQLVTLCEQIITTCKEPVIVDGHSCLVGVSIGVATGIGPPKQPSQIFIDADAALYEAKEAGRCCYRIFDDAIQYRSKNNAGARQDLLDALANDDITCYYQPQYDAKSLTIVGAEALLRWDCGNRGVLVPAQFIANAQKAGLMGRIDAIIFAKVIAQQNDWLSRGIPYPSIALNISQERLHDPEMLVQVRDLLKPHHSIAFELLETAFMDDLDDTVRSQLESLRDLGIRIEMDDFGSGHASIVAMQEIKPARVKIDQRLVRPIDKNPGQLLMLRSLTSVARMGGCDVVIEGLDSQVHLAAIGNVDCDVLQGHALKVPLPSVEFENLITNQNVVVANK